MKDKDEEVMDNGNSCNPYNRNGHPAIVASGTASSQELIDYLLSVIRYQKDAITGLELKFKRLALDREVESNKIDRQLEVLSDVGKMLKESKSKIRRKKIFWIF